MVGKRAPTETRFWAKVEKSAGCWTWTGGTNGAGYGMLWSPEAGRKVLAHRFSYELHKGSIPGGLLACHHCDNRGCVNPEHIYAGDHRRNGLDAVDRGRHRHGAPKRDAAGKLLHPPPHRRGEEHSHAKLTEADVREIHRRRMAGEASTTIAATFGVGAPAIKLICAGKTWSHMLAEPGSPTVAQMREAVNTGKSRRLTNAARAAIRAAYAADPRPYVVARQFGVDHKTVRKLVQALP